MCVTDKVNLPQEKEMKQKLLNPPQDHNSHRHTEQNGSKENGVGFFKTCVITFLFIYVSYGLIYEFVPSRHEPQMRWTSRRRRTWKGKSCSLSNGKKKRDCFRKNGRERNRRKSKLSRVSHTQGNRWQVSSKAWSKHTLTLKHVLWSCLNMVVLKSACF